MMEPLLMAISHANPIWLQTVRQVGWHHTVIALLYLACAFLCYLHTHLLRDDLHSPKLWLLATGLLCVLAANTVLQAEVWLTHTLRALAQAAGWYEARRPLQYMATVGLVLLAYGGSRRLGAGLANQGAYSVQLSLGMALLLLLMTLRAVSAHATDALLGLRWLGISLGRLCELTGLGLVLLGSWRSLHYR